MNLSTIEIGKETIVKSIGGQEEQRLFLESLGFVPGTRVKVVLSVDGNLIVNIKESRVALGREMAERMIAV